MDVVVSVEPRELDTVRHALSDYGAALVDEEPGNGNHLLVWARFSNEPTAAAAVEHARRLGLAATTRPTGGGRLAAWRRDNDAIVIDENLTIALPWSDPSSRRGPNVVEIDPGSSFGAGRHPSTQLVLAELSRRIRGNDRVLDVGCGSGVLAVAAAVLGAEHVTAVDTDDRAVASTIANAERNGVGALVDATGEPLAAIDAIFDVVLADVDAAAIVELAPALTARLGPSGWLGLGGITAEQAPTVTERFGELVVESERRRDHWIALVLRRA